MVKRTSNAQRRTSNAEYRRLNSKLDVRRSLVTSRRLCASALASRVLRLIFGHLRLSAANRTLPYARRFAYSRERSMRAPPRLPALALASGHARRSLLPTLQLRRLCPSILEQFVQPSFFRGR